MSEWHEGSITNSSVSSIFPLVNFHLMIGIIVSITAVACCAVYCLSKQLRASNRADSAANLISTDMTSASPTTQSEVGQYSPSLSSQVRYAPVPTISAVTEEPPPPYPGKECTPQYPPAGQWYPWQQSATVVTESS